MVNYRKDRERINVNGLGSLYINKNIGEKIKNGFCPVIYIGGQMEHRLHKWENRTGVTFDVGHSLFDGSWFYEYSNRGTKSNINTENFADNLAKSLEVANLEDVDIITESYGGLIAVCASKSPRIHKVVAIHPPLLGTPLASNDKLEDALIQLEKRNKRIAWIVDKVVNDRFGFQQDNAIGINNIRILNSIDFSKLTVVGSNMDRENDKSIIARYLYDLIYALEEKESDGVVLFDETRFKSLGINCIKDTHPINHFDAGSEKNIMRVAAMTLEGFEFPEDDESRLIGTATGEYSENGYKSTEKDIDSTVNENINESEHCDDDFDVEDELKDLEYISLNMDDLFEDVDRAKDNLVFALRKTVEEDRRRALKLYCSGSNE